MIGLLGAFVRDVKSQGRCADVPRCDVNITTVFEVELLFAMNSLA